MMPAPYREFAERWGSPEFSKYVEELQRQADEAMKDIDQVGSSEDKRCYLWKP